MNNKQEYDQTLEMVRLCHISFADEKVFIAFFSLLFSIKLREIKNYFCMVKI